MQEDFKNQLQNAFGLWRKKGQNLIGEWVSGAKAEVRNRLSQNGLAERWTSLVSLVEEVAPELTPQFASYLGVRRDSLAYWLGIKVMKWEPYRIEVGIEAQSHLMQDDIESVAVKSSKNQALVHYNWQSSSLVALAETTARWLIEKHAPIGDFKIKTLKVEQSILSQGFNKCIARSELNPPEFENCMASLMKNSVSEFAQSVMILSENETLVCQVYFNFEFQWTPLIK